MERREKSSPREARNHFLDICQEKAYNSNKSCDRDETKTRKRQREQGAKAETLCDEGFCYLPPVRSVAERSYPIKQRRIVCVKDLIRRRQFCRKQSGTAKIVFRLCIWRVSIHMQRFLFSHAVRRISILQSKNIELPERQYIELMLMKINISISTKGKMAYS